LKGGLTPHSSVCLLWGPLNEDQENVVLDYTLCLINPWCSAVLGRCMCPRWLIQ
jgi:hypothetical protein